MDNVFLNNFLALQILVECLAEELIATELISQESLDKRVQEKIQMLEKLNDELEITKNKINSNFFNGKMGEA